VDNLSGNSRPACSFQRYEANRLKDENEQRDEIISDACQPQAGNGIVFQKRDQSRMATKNLILEACVETLENALGTEQ
jgi:hypothetical protein